MGKKIVYEVTQPVVDGNEVVVNSGYQYDAAVDGGPDTGIPDYVTVRAVIVEEVAP